MKAMTALESIRLYLSALWHTIIWPKTTLGQAVVGYIIFYFVLLWERRRNRLWSMEHPGHSGLSFMGQKGHQMVGRTQLVQDPAHGHEPSWHEKLHDHRAARLPQRRRDASSVVARDLLGNIVK